MDFLIAIFAVVAAVAGGGLLWWRRSVGSEIALMAAAETSRAGDAAKLAPGTLVEVKGTLRCRSVLAAEFSQKPCAYFRAVIEREETYYERDSQGKEQRKTRTTTVYSNVKYGSCLIEDESGKVGIDFDGATVEAIETVDEATTAPDGGGGIVGGLLSVVSGRNESYRRKESILPADIPVYLLGEVRPDGLIGKPAAGSKNKAFIISHKSEEERTSDLTSTTRLLLVGAIVAFAVAIGLLVWSIKEGKSVPAKAANVEITQRA